MNKSQEQLAVARNSSCQKQQLPETDFHYETEARKVMVDFNFDALYTGKSS